MTTQHLESQRSYQSLIREMFEKSRLLELVPSSMRDDAVEAAELLLNQEIGAWIVRELPGEKLKNAMSAESVCEVAKECIPDFQKRLEEKIEDFFSRFLASLNDVYASVPELKQSNV